MLGGQEKELYAPKIDLLLNAYNKMNYDAFAPGDTDLSLSVEELVRMSRRAQFPFLLANLLDRKSQKPVFTPYLIKNVGGLKVGLFALLSNNLDLRRSTGDREKYRLADAVATARKISAELKAQKCEVLIALAHMEEDEQKNLAQALKGVQFIVSGHARTVKPEIQEINNVEILRAGTRGEYLGQVEFFTAEKRLYSHYQLIPLNPKQPDQPAVAKMVQDYKIRIQNLLPEPDWAELEKAHDSRPAHSPESGKQ
jgi:5'-nucleotidase / UDP-sugar diphosphatase